MMKNCIIIEDQPPAQRILQKYIADTNSLHLKGTFSDAIAAIDFLNTEKIDFIFLDIHLPKISGIEFLKSVPNHPYIILTTAFSEYALESYEYNVVDYLLKPFSFQRFIKAVSKVPALNETSTVIETKKPKDNMETIFIKSGNDFIKVTISDITFIKSDADYTEIVIDKKKHLTSYSLKYWLKKLDNNQFTQIHKSYIINVSLINKISGNQVFLENGTIIPIGRVFKEMFTHTFLK